MKNLKCKIIKGELGFDIEREIDRFLYNKDIEIVSVNTVVTENQIIVNIIYSLDKILDK